MAEKEPIKSLDELGELHPGQEIILNYELGRESELRAKNNGFNPGDSYFIRDVNFLYKKAPFSPVEFPEPENQTIETTPYTANITIENAFGVYTGNYQDFSKPNQESQ